jgi:cell division septal protein FtsQ
LRKKKILWLVFVWIIALVSVCSAVLLFLNSHFIRISSISIEGDSAVLNEQVQSIVSKSISGDYFWFIPKDSFFLFPSHDFSRIIPSEFPSIAKISFSHRGLTAITAIISERSPYAIACIGQGQGDCYYADDNGIIFQSASSTDGAFLVYHISLPNGANPLGLQFIDGGRLAALGAFVSALAQLGFIDDSINISTSTNYDFSLQYQKEDLSSNLKNPSMPISISNSSFPSTSTPILHLIINESRPFSETLLDFSAFWQEYESKATSTLVSKLSSVDMRYGDNIIFKTK